MQRRRWAIGVSRAALGLAALSVGVLAVGGYFDSHAFALHRPDGPPRHYPLAVVYWSGDMGARLGYGSRIIEDLRDQGVPVLSVTSPVLFGQQRDRAFVIDAVARSLRVALAASGAERIAVVASSFGADVVGIGLGHVGPDLKKRVASVVLIAPGVDIYFRANPSGIFYRGAPAANPNRAIPLLRGLPVTCIFGAQESDSLCRQKVMLGARRVPIDGGHMMLFSHGLLATAVEAAVHHPPAPMR
jgi:type IV secretory pathway VirJ component